MSTKDTRLDMRAYVEEIKKIEKERAGLEYEEESDDEQEKPYNPSKIRIDHKNVGFRVVSNSDPKPHQQNPYG